MVTAKYFTDNAYQVKQS